MHARGVEVTVVHLMGHLMERQLDDPAAGYLSAEGTGGPGDQGRTERSSNSKEILGEDGKVKASCVLDNGTDLPCDLLVMAVGIRPEPRALAKDGRSGEWAGAFTSTTRW